jgi:hypothetical protein
LQPLAQLGNLGPFRVDALCPVEGCLHGAEIASLKLREGFRNRSAIRIRRNLALDARESFARDARGWLQIERFRVSAACLFQIAGRLGGATEFDLGEDVWQSPRAREPLCGSRIAGRQCCRDLEVPDCRRGVLCVQCAVSLCERQPQPFRLAGKQLVEGRRDVAEQSRRFRMLAPVMDGVRLPKDVLGVGEADARYRCGAPYPAALVLDPRETPQRLLAQPVRLDALGLALDRRGRGGRRLCRFGR